MKASWAWATWSLAVTAGGAAWGQTVTVSFDNINAVVPDDNSAGAANRQIVTQPGVVAGLAVTLDLVGVGAGGYNGDLYVLLSHGGASSVLLNRVGVDASNPFGYGDNGLNVTFADRAQNGDIHLYQTVVDPAGGTLTGVWAPDARRADPGLVTTGSPRTAFLSNFTGLPASGPWTLFLADLSGGGELELKSWSLNFVPVPEPESAGLTAAGLLCVVAGWRLLRGRRSAH